jgi:hypothetical protein
MCRTLWLFGNWSENTRSDTGRGPALAQQRHNARPGPPRLIYEVPASHKEGTKRMMPRVVSAAPSSPIPPCAPGFWRVFSPTLRPMCRPGMVSTGRMAELPCPGFGAHRSGAGTALRSMSDRVIRAVSRAEMRSWPVTLPEHRPVEVRQARPLFSE